MAYRTCVQKKPSRADLPFQGPCTNRLPVWRCTSSQVRPAALQRQQAAVQGRQGGQDRGALLYVNILPGERGLEDVGTRRWRPARPAAAGSSRHRTARAGRGGGSKARPVAWRYTYDWGSGPASVIAPRPAAPAALPPGRPRLRLTGRGLLTASLPSAGPGSGGRGRGNDGSAAALVP